MKELLSIFVLLSFLFLATLINQIIHGKMEVQNQYLIGNSELTDMIMVGVRQIRHLTTG